MDWNLCVVLLPTHNPKVARKPDALLPSSYITNKSLMQDVVIPDFLGRGPLSHGLEASPLHPRNPRVPKRKTVSAVRTNVAVNGCAAMW